MPPVGDNPVIIPPILQDRGEDGGRAQQVRCRTGRSRNCRHFPIGLCRASAPRPARTFRHSRISAIMAPAVAAASWAR